MCLFVAVLVSTCVGGRAWTVLLTCACALFLTIERFTVQPFDKLSVLSTAEIAESMVKQWETYKAMRVSWIGYAVGGCCWLLCCSNAVQ